MMADLVNAMKWDMKKDFMEFVAFFVLLQVIRQRIAAVFG